MGYPGSPTSNTPSSLWRHRSALLLLPPSSTRPTPPLSSSIRGPRHNVPRDRVCAPDLARAGTSFGHVRIARRCTTGYSFISGHTSGCGRDKARADLRLLVVKRGLLWSAKIAYMVLFLRIIIPTLIALPIWLSLDPILVPRICIVDEWAIGPAGCAAYNDTTGRYSPEPVTATRKVIGPVTFGLLGMILFAFLLTQYFIPIIPRNSRLLFMEVYPAILRVRPALTHAWAVVHPPPLPPPLARPPPPTPSSYGPRPLPLPLALAPRAPILIPPANPARSPPGEYGAVPASGEYEYADGTYEDDIPVPEYPSLAPFGFPRGEPLVMLVA
ncbi:hypothetical protein B0H14DRAFT_3558990 [Mycena olivaceomarginata]|nr:hypothetical protein B0H14DRAFT_3558990 [Mycena olivaceomarginata]